MTIEEFNKTPQGQLMFSTIMELDEEISRILGEVWEATEEVSTDAIVSWNDTGFVEIENP